MTKKKAKAKGTVSPTKKAKVSSEFLRQLDRKASGKSRVRETKTPPFTWKKDVVGGEAPQFAPSNWQTHVKRPEGSSYPTGPDGRPDLERIRREIKEKASKD